MSPTSLDVAIVRTLAYADVFHFPMTAAEIHHFLIGESSSLTNVQVALLHPSAWLRGYIQERWLDGEPYYALDVAETTIFEQRAYRQQVSAQLWPQAVRYGTWLGWLPFVRMVAITGALSVQNVSSPDDDLDYILVVKNGRVWLARLFAVAMVRIARLWNVTLCPNYVLATDAMALSEADLFLAHEVTQMVPLVGHLCYQEMRDLNEWAIYYLPNATAPFFKTSDEAPRAGIALLKRFLEWCLGGALGDRVEAWEMRRKLQKLGASAQPSDEVKLDAQQVKGHFMNYGQITLQRYQTRLVQLGLMPHPSDQSSAAD